MTSAKPAWLGQPLVDLEWCESTNDEAAHLAQLGIGHGAVVVAGSQRKGRGRQGRAWFSPPGENLYLSCVLRPKLAPRELPPITLAAGVAVADAVRRFGSFPTLRLKWPNDVLVADRKLAGVLVEMTTRGAEIDSAIVGIGINVNSLAFPGDLASRATSIARERGEAVAVSAVRDALLFSLERAFDAFFASGLGDIAAEWTAQSGMAGARVRVEVGDGTALLGTARGIDPSGALDVVDDNGHHHRIASGEVILEPVARRLKESL